MQAATCNRWKTVVVVIFNLSNPATTFLGLFIKDVQIYLPINSLKTYRQSFLYLNLFVVSFRKFHLEKLTTVSTTSFIKSPTEHNCFYYFIALHCLFERGFCSNGSNLKFTVVLP